MTWGTITKQTTQQAALGNNNQIIQHHVFYQQWQWGRNRSNDFKIQMNNNQTNKQTQVNCKRLHLKATGELQ